MQSEIFQAFDYYAAQNLTLVCTKFLIDEMKGMFKQTFTATVDQQSRGSAGEDAFSHARISVPAGTDLGISPGRWLAYVHIGLQVVRKS